MSALFELFQRVFGKGSGKSHMTIDPEPRHLMSDAHLRLMMSDSDLQARCFPYDGVWLKPQKRGSWVESSIGGTVPGYSCLNISGMERLRQLVSKCQVQLPAAGMPLPWRSADEVASEEFGPFRYCLFDKIQRDGPVKYEYALAVCPKEVKVPYFVVSLEYSESEEEQGRRIGPYVCVSIGEQRVNFGRAPECLDRPMFFHTAAHLSAELLYRHRTA
jgi:hypothetical protein